MEHRKFLQRLDELVAELTHAQAQKVIAALQQRGEGDEVQRILEQRIEDEAKCPHCGSLELSNLIRRVSLLTSEDTRLERLSDPSRLSGVDEDDPRSVAAWARKMQSKMGDEEVEPEFEEMLDRMEAGEMPDDIADDEGDDGLR